MRPDKALKFMLVAEHYAQLFSKDSSTKVGAVFVDPEDFTQLTQGYNGMPRKVNEGLPHRQERPAKYMYYEHAERNAIYNMARRKLMGSVIVSRCLPSLSCARAAISVGAKEIWLPHSSNWTTELSVAMALFEETGVYVRWFERSTGELLDRSSPRPAHIQEIERQLRQHSRVLHSEMSMSWIYAPGTADEVSHGFLGRVANTLSCGLATERYVGECGDMWIESSLRDAIYRYVRPMLQGSVCLVTATTCVECARAIASVGCVKMVYLEPDESFKQRWGDSIDAALSLLSELGVGHQSITRAQLDELRKNTT